MDVCHRTLRALFGFGEKVFDKWDDQGVDEKHFLKPSSVSIGASLFKLHLGRKSKRMRLQIVFTLAMACLGSIAVVGQEETLFGNADLEITGAWFSSTHNFSFYSQEVEYLSGGNIGLEFGRSFILGWAWQRVRDEASFLDNDQDYELNHHGLLLAYVPHSYRAFHPYFSAYAGGGRVKQKGGDSDRIFGITPAVGVEANLTDWLRLGAEGGYRFIMDVDLPELESPDVSAPFIQLQLRLGYSWGFW